MCFPFRDVDPGCLPFRQIGGRAIRGAVLGLFLVLSACGTGGTTAEGKRIYANRCYSCHGDTGTGDGPTARAMGIKPANLQTAVREKSKGELLGIITGGRQVMPAFGHILTEAQQEAVVQYLRTLKGEKATVARGLDPAGVQGLR